MIKESTLSETPRDHTAAYLWFIEKPSKAAHGPQVIVWDAGTGQTSQTTVWLRF